MMLKKLFQTSIVVLAMVLFGRPISAQSPTVAVDVHCGDILQSENTPDQKVQVFRLLVPAGTTLNGRVEPLGSTFNIYLDFADTSGRDFLRINDGIAGVAEQFNDLVVAQTNPLLAVVGYRPDGTHDTGLGKISDLSNWSGFEYYGAYTIYLGCTSPEGVVTNPGEPPPNILIPTPAFSGNGFPGLPPKDFSDGVLLPLTTGTPNAGSITTNFTGVFGYTFDANANDVFALDFTRLSGNLNLGLAVLSPDNKIVFQTSLVTSDTLSTRFTLPNAGTYTIGVYKIDLLSLVSPENTSFQIVGTINP